MREALTAEVTSRELELGGDARVADVPAGPEPAMAEGLRASLDLRALLDGLADDVRAYTALGEGLAGKSAFVRELAEDVRLLSLNALLASARLEEGAALSAVAGLQRTRSDRIGPVLGRSPGTSARRRRCSTRCASASRRAASRPRCWRGPSRRQCAR